MNARRHITFRRYFTCLMLLSFAVAAVSGFGCRTAGAASERRSPRTNELSVRPGVNDPYKDPDVNTWIERFEGESREIYANRQRIIETINIRPGSVVADIGAGTGFMTVLFAKEVGPGGRVYAVDIVPEFLDLIRTRASEKGLGNIETVLCTEDSVELPPSSIDLAVLCDVYHHFEFPRSTMSTIHQALKPDGELIVIDFVRDPGKTRAWVLNHVRAGKETVLEELKASGFKLIDDNTRYDFLPENYLMRLQKVGESGAHDVPSDSRDNARAPVAL